MKFSRLPLLPSVFLGIASTAMPESYSLDDSVGSIHGGLAKDGSAGPKCMTSTLADPDSEQTDMPMYTIVEGPAFAKNAIERPCEYSIQTGVPGPGTYPVVERPDANEVLSENPGLVTLILNQVKSLLLGQRFLAPGSGVAEGVTPLVSSPTSTSDDALPISMASPPSSHYESDTSISESMPTDPFSSSDSSPTSDANATVSPAESSSFAFIGTRRTDLMISAMASFIGIAMFL